MSKKITQAIQIELEKLNEQERYKIDLENHEYGARKTETTSETLGKVFKNITGNTILLNSSKNDKFGEGSKLNWKVINETMTKSNDAKKLANKERSRLEGIEKIRDRVWKLTARNQKG